MEQKSIKTQVFVNDVIFSDSAEQPVDVDFTLPDYCPDITKILKCRAVSRISAKGMNGRNISADGTVTITVIYADAENRLCSYEYQYPFSKSFESSCDCDGAELFCRTKCEYINCRAVTGRKIDIHGAAGIYIKATKRKCTDIISDIDDPNIELRRGSAPATSPMGSAEKYLLVEEEIEIGQGQPSVRSLIRYDAGAGIKDSKLVNEKAIVKGEMVVTLLYCPEQGSPQSVKSTIPFSQLVEMPGVNDSCSCDTRVEIAYLEIKPRTSASGEIRSFTMNAKLLISCEAYCDNDVAVILDAYSRRYEANITRSEISFNKICKTIAEVYHCKSNLEFPDGALSGVADLWCDVQTGSIRVEGEQMIICGTVTADIVAYDSDGVPVYYEKTIDFQYKYPLSGMPHGIHCEPQIEVLSANYTITGAGNMELRVELAINAAVYESNDVPLIVDLTVDEKQPIHKKDRGAMTIYFAAGGEHVWDIARRYCASVNEIMQVNDITEEILAEDKMILVPMN